MNLVMNPVPGEESAVVDLTMRAMVHAGRALGKDLRSRKDCSKDITLFIRGEWRYAKTDVCVVDKNSHLLVQKDKRHLETMDPGPRLKAAVHSNNRT